MSPVGVSRRSIAALVCLALAATPAAAQVKADGTPVQTTPTVKHDNSGAAAAAAGAIAIGTAIWLHHRAEEKKNAEAAAAAAAATPPVPAPVQTVATTPTATEPVPAPAPAAVEPAPKPIPVVAKKPVHLSHHGSSTSSNLKAAAVVPVAPAAVPAAEPVQAPPVVRAAPLPAAASKPANSNFALWIALEVLGALLLAVGALPRMRMAPPTFRARARMSPPRVSVPVFTQSKVEAA